MIEDYFDEDFTVKRPTEDTKNADGDKIMTYPVVDTFKGKRESVSGDLTEQNEKETIIITDIIYGPLGKDIKVGDLIFDNADNKFRIEYDEKIIKADHIELRTRYIK